MCCQENDFDEDSLKSTDNSHVRVYTAESVYSHLNMDMGQYNTFDRTLSRCQKMDADLHSSQAEEWNCYNTDSECSWRNKQNESLSFEKLDQCSQIANELETNRAQETENFTIGMTKQRNISPLKGKLEAKHLQELSRKVQSFKSLTEDV
jgi:hypothetical protein